MNWSHYQRAIFDFVKHDTRSAVVIAVAGSGKTTTLVEAAKHIPETAQSTFVAFNKHIAEALAAKLPDYVRCMTMNAMGFRAWRKVTSDVKLEPKKTWVLMEDLWTSQEVRKYGKVVNQLVGLAKQVGIVPVLEENFTEPRVLIEDTFDAWMSLCDQFNVQLEEGQTFSEVIRRARIILAQSNVRCLEVMDFNDQLYLPIIYRAPFLRNDFLFVDEAQDLNEIQLFMIEESLKTNGRLIAVGDPAQAIYAFRGAKNDAIENIAERFSAVRLPLTICYRCPKKIVAHARAIGDDYKHIEASETAEEGEIFAHQPGEHDLTPGDIVLCRNNKPLVALYFKLKQEGQKARLLGKDVTQVLINLVKKLRPVSLKDLELRLDAHQKKETATKLKQNPFADLSYLNDLCDTLRVFMEQCKTLVELIQLMSATQAAEQDPKQMITLSTIHKAKGLEFPHVYFLDSFLIPSKYATTREQLTQEDNLRYVTITRTQKTLNYITSEAQ